MVEIQERKIHRFLAAYIIYTHGRNPPKLNGYAARDPPKCQQRNEWAIPFVILSIIIHKIQKCL